MTKIFTFLFAVVLAASSIAQVTVPAVTKSLYNKKTASWCAPCYEWGIGVDDNVMSAAGNKTVAIKLCASPSGNLYNVACANMYAAFDNQGHTGWPNFFVNALNRTEYVGGGISPSTTTSNCTAAINSFYSATTADINAGFNVTFTTNSIIVDVTTKFFNAMNGNYSTAIYIIEDNVVHQQNTDGGYVSNVMSEVLRASIAGSSTFGVSVGSGSVAAGTLVNGQYTVAIDPAWNTDNIRVVSVVWENLGGGSYTVVNANDVPSSTIGVGINEETNGFNAISIYPNPANEIVNVLINASEIQSITVFNALGEKVLINYTAQTAKLTTFDISSLENGIYYIAVLDKNNNQSVEKFVKY